MFSQVLICVWREVLEFIIHPTGGGHGPGRLPAPEPASWLYWHVPSVMNAAQVHLRNSLVRQPSRERSAERRHSASAAAARRSRLALGGQEGTNWNWGRKASVFLSVFLIFLLSFSNPLLPLNTVLPLGNYWLWRKEHRHAAFQQQDRFGLLFCFLTRAGGETMIKSSWFYVKFKYAEKVSGCIFSCSLSQGIAAWSPAAPSDSSSGHQRSQRRWEVWLVNLCFGGSMDNAVPRAGTAQGASRVTAATSAWCKRDRKDKLRSNSCGAV